MNSKQILQESKIYLFGEGEEYATREDARKAVEKKLQSVQTELAMQRMYDKAQTDIVEGENGFRIAVILNIPQFV